MLLEFRVENYRSFAEEQTLSFVAGKDRSLPKHTAPVPGLESIRVLRFILLYGANGSGKSNLVRAIEFVNHFVSESAVAYSPNDRIDVQPCLLTPNGPQNPSRFEVTFVTDGIRYQYGFAATPARIVEEWCLAYPTHQPRRLFDRRVEADGKTQWYFGPHLRGEREAIRAMTRDNALYLSTAAQWNLGALMPVHRWLSTNLGVLVRGSGLLRPRAARQLVSLFDFTARRAKDDPDFRDQVADLLRQADTGIVGFEVEEVQHELPPEVHQILALVPAAARGNFPGMATELRVTTRHQRTEDGRPVDWPLQEESNGTQALFTLSGPLLDARHTGEVLCLDEDFANLHPSLIRMLLKVFVEPTNPDGPAGQLLVTLHDATQLDSDAVRRDQVWLVEKGRSQVSKLYSLYDFERKPRKHEALERGYLSGRYGAVPFLPRAEPF